MIHESDRIFVTYDIGFHQTFEHSARTVVVGTDDGEVGHAEELSHVVHAKVEFMVANGDSIVAHLIHQANLHLSFEERVVAGALREVARVEEQQTGILAALFLDHIDATEEAATTCQVLVVDVRIERQDGGVRIVGMENHQLLVLLGDCGQTRQEY